MTRLSRHSNPIRGILPQISYLQKHVIPDPGPGGHWFWREDLRNHRLNRHGHAVLAMKIKRKPGYIGSTSGEYCVARVLLDHHRGPFPPRTSFTLLCGLPQCVNPAHWKPLIPSPPWRLDYSVESSACRLVSTNSGAPSTRDLLINVTHDNVVHVVPIKPDWSSDLFETICHKRIDPFQCSVTTFPITCKEGC